MSQKELKIALPSVTLQGELNIPKNAKGLVIFSHGSGSSRLSPRNKYVAEVIQSHGIATLLFDLLTEEEDSYYQTRFDIKLLTSRLIETTKWIMAQKDVKGLGIGYFGASTGAASALKAAAALPDIIKAVISRGGRPDLAEEALEKVKADVLLIVGGNDAGVIELNEEAYNRMDTTKEFKIIPGATHLFEEPGKLEQVALIASEWYEKHLKGL